MRVMQVAIHQIICVLPVWHRFMTAVRAVNVARGVAAATMLWGALGLICAIRGQLVFVDVILVDVVQMSIVEVVRVSVVPNGDVATVRAVDVCMPFVFGACCSHNLLPLCWNNALGCKGLSTFVNKIWC